MAVGDQVVELVEMGQLNRVVDERVASAISGHAADDARHNQAGGLPARSNPGVQGEVFFLVGATEADHKVQLKWGESWLDLAVAGWNSLRGRPTAFAPQTHRGTHNLGGGDPLINLELAQFAASAKNPVDPTIPALRSLGAASFEAAPGNDPRLRSIYKDATLFAHRRKTRYQGPGVNVSDDPTNDQLIVEITGAAAGPASRISAGVTEYADATEAQDPNRQDRAIDPAGLQAEITRRLTPEAWIAPTLLNGWLNYGAPYAAAGYYKDPSGRVYLRGVVKSGAVSTTATGNVFVLPAGYRPAGQSLFGVHGGTGFARLEILADGAVRAWAGSNAFWQLDGISFRAEQ